MLDDVDATLEQPADDIELEAVGHVQHAVGLGGEDVFDVVRRETPVGRAAQVTGIPADLVRAVDEQADEVQSAGAR